MVDWSMYIEIQNLKNKKFKKAQVARKLSLNRETVAKYWDMPPDVYEKTRNVKRARKPDEYRDFIIECLTEYPDISAAQLYDWCKERKNVETLDFQKRSFQNYVNDIREQYDIRKPEKARQYEAVDEREPGRQAQVDMGEIYVSTQEGRRKKIYCFAVVLAHSRYKYIEWRERPFTTVTFIQAHINAFRYFGGRPDEIVYDQDKVLSVSENSGDIIYTSGFQNYVDAVKFNVYLCRGFDPESKGMVENVVKFAKRGFADHRTFTDIDSFNEACLAWLKRTANYDKHGTTHKRPVEVFALEKEYLTPVSEYSFASATKESISYAVRKDNIVLYKGNRYRVPVGTYHAGIRVYMVVDEGSDTVSITDMITGEVYATHPVCHDKGKLIGHSERKDRDLSLAIREQEEKVKELFDNNDLIGSYLEHIHHDKKRYYRDQLGSIRRLFDEWDKDEIMESLRYCSEHELYSAGELKSGVIYLTQRKGENKRKLNTDVLLPKKYRTEKTEVRSLKTYEDAMDKRSTANG